MGRPKKEINLTEEDIQAILSLYEDGGTDISVKAYIIRKYGSISNDLWYRLIKENEIFSETIYNGKILSQDWWEEQGRINLKNVQFQTGLWYANMKNRFNWSDNRQTDESKTFTLPEIRIKYESTSTGQEESNSK